MMLIMPHLQIAEGHLRLNHPELSEMPAGVAVFCSEGWAKGVDAAEATGEVLGLELARDGEESRLGEEVLGQDHITAMTNLVTQSHISHLQHSGCTRLLVVTHSSHTQQYT
jgi:hypothetical protein